VRKGLSTLNDIFFTVVDRDEPRLVLYRKNDSWSAVSSGDFYRNVISVAGALTNWGIRKGDRVAILNTTLRLVGRPDELRESLFSRSLLVETLAPLAAPGEVFSSTNGVESWRTEGASSYVLTVTDPRNIAPRVIRALVAAGADVVSITESRHSLEDVYLQLIDEDPEASRR